jgi:hypothetical protein
MRFKTALSNTYGFGPAWFGGTGPEWPPAEAHSTPKNKSFFVDSVQGSCYISFTWKEWYPYHII